MIGIVEKIAAQTVDSSTVLSRLISRRDKLFKHRTKRQRIKHLEDRVDALENTMKEKKENEH